MHDQDATLSDIARSLNREYVGSDCLPAAFFITDAAAVPDPDQIIRALPSQVAVIFRDYDHPERAALGLHLRNLCRERGVIFLVAGGAELAQALEADGLHLPERLMGDAPQLRAAYPDYLITAACHNLMAVRRASELPIDALLVAPVFPTQSHPETLESPEATLGLPGLREILAASSQPVYALGGMTKENARLLRGTGVAGIAAIRGFSVA